MYNDLVPAVVALVLIAATFAWACVSDMQNLRHARPVLEPAPEVESQTEFYEVETPDAA